MTTTTQALGVYGETLAAQHLVRRGMVLLDHNWRCEAGEVDLVLRDGRDLVFCEVKTRRSVARGTPQEAVTEQKAARMRRVAAAWIEAHDLRSPAVRLDLVAVLAPRRGDVQIDHQVGIG